MNKIKTTLTAIALCAIAFTTSCSSGDDNDNPDQTSGLSSGLEDSSSSSDGTGEGGSSSSSVPDNPLSSSDGTGGNLSSSSDNSQPGSSGVQVSTTRYEIQAGTDGVEVDVVKLIIDVENYEGEEISIAEAPYLNGGFKIDIPDIVDARYLDGFDASDLGENDTVTISDEGAKVVGGTLVAFKDGKTVGSFYLGQMTDRMFGNFYYADRDFTMEGTIVSVEEMLSPNGPIIYGYDSAIYDMSLKAGWNYLYVKMAEDYEDEDGILHSKRDITTSAPSGSAWFFIKNNSEEDGDSYDQPSVE